MSEWVPRRPRRLGDTVNSSVSYALSANVERLTLTGTANIDGTGNLLDNLIVASAGSNTLVGDLGNDTMSYAAATAGVTVSLAVTAAQVTGGSGTDTFNGFENLIGSAFGDTLTGAAGVNILTGGAGNDTYVVQDATDVVVEIAAGGTADTVLSSVSYVLAAEVENLTLTGVAALNGTGNALNNLIIANAGNNVLDGAAGTADTVSYEAALSAVAVSLALTAAQVTGGSGTDTLTGFENLTGSAFGDTLTGTTGTNTLKGLAGDDIYFVQETADVVTEAANEGIDTVNSSATYTLGLNVENLILTGTAAINGTGNILDNLIVASAGNNVLGGSTGIDTVSYVNATAGVTLSLTATAAQVTGGSGSDTLSGFENVIGSAFNDKLTGSVVNNIFTGGAGVDQFVFNTALNGTTNVDNITDFLVVDDTVVLENAIFTKFTTLGTLGSGNFVIGSAAADADDYLVYNSTTGELSYDADGNGVGVATKVANLTTGLALTNADFVII